jgi:uridine phosphorylase
VLLAAITKLLRESNEQDWPLQPYFTAASSGLLEKFSDGQTMHRGITLTAAGFYAPQGRQLRLPSRFDHAVIDRLATWKGSGGERITNLEMETAGIYGLAELLGHRALSLNALLANRASGTFSQRPGETVDRLIDYTLERLGTEAK